MRGKIFYNYLAAILLCIVLIFLLMTVGAVKLPVKDIFITLFGKEANSPYIKTIVMETRLPMVIASACCGATLSVAGLIMQTVFNNPLAGPSVLGISSGASFGVALLTMAASGIIVYIGTWSPFLIIISALIGAVATIGILLIFSSVIRSGLTLLIVGIMISYLCSSGISLLNYFSPAEEIRNFLIWGLGSYTGLRLHSSLWFLAFTIIALIPAFFFIKPLNAMLLGERHLESLGFNNRIVRRNLLILTGLLVGVPTAFCGPIGFIGLIVPHICRLIMRSSNHLILIPGSIIFGAMISLLCAFIGVLPSSHYGVLPINIITPVIGVPIILYLLLNRHKLPYFS